VRAPGNPPGMAERDRQEERARQVLQEKQAEPRTKAEEEELAASERPQDEPPTKSSGRRKKTAPE
jgi:hypothetical protein